MDKFVAAEAERSSCWDNIVREYATKSGVLKERAKEINDAHAELRQKKSKRAKTNGNPKASDRDILDVNAGGQIFRVSRGTMTYFQGSRLEALFSGRWDLKLMRDSKGRIFLDVNPICFNSIVDYLNECKIAAPDDMPDPPYVGKEHEGFLDGLLTAFGLDEICTAVQRIESVILTDVDHVSALMQFLNESGVSGGLELLYRGSRDGMTPASFHGKCDNQGSTLTVIKSQGGHVFGAYVDKDWQSLGDYRPSNKAFLFGLRCFSSNDPCKLPLALSDCEYAIYDHHGRGPMFGAGTDLSINLQSDSSTVSSSLGPSYRLPKGNRNTFNRETFLTDDGRLVEIEVFKVDNASSRVKPPSSVNKTSSSGISGDWVNESFNGFPNDVKDIFLREKQALVEATMELSELQDAFGKEDAFIQAFTKGDDQSRTVSLNVSGHPMEVRTTTLEQFPESVLFKQLADPLWNRARGGDKVESPRNWEPKEVVDWVAKINGLSEGVSNFFEDTTGAELLAMDREDVKDLGIKKAGAVALLSRAIKDLRDKELDSSAILIEHSDYCMGKIIDYMRLKAMTGIGVPAPSPPEICEPEKKRFQRIVEFHFPDKSEAAEFLGL